MKCPHAKEHEYAHVLRTIVNGRTHHYHAEANILSGHLRLPLEQQIKPQAHTHLPKEGGYFSHRAERFRLESVISFRSGIHARCRERQSQSPDGGWTTLATTVIEGLNVMEVVTADRIVGQTITEHPARGLRADDQFPWYAL